MEFEGISFVTTLPAPMVTLTAVALHRVITMAGRVDADIWADKTVITNGDTGFIEHSEVEVGKEPFAYAYLFTVIAVERLVDEKFVISCMTKQALQYFLHPQSFRWT